VVLERNGWSKFMVLPERRTHGEPGLRAQAGRYDSTRFARAASTRPRPRQSEDARGVPSNPTPPRIPGRSLVSRRAVTDIVRGATLGSYGVAGFAGSRWLDRIGQLLGLPPRGIAIGLGEQLTIDLDVTIAHGLPIAEVARQVDSAVRYAIRRSLDRDVDRLTIHVGGLRAGPPPIGSAPGRDDRQAAAGPTAIRPDDLAASGTDVA